MGAWVLRWCCTGDVRRNGDLGLWPHVDRLAAMVLHEEGTEEDGVVELVAGPDNPLRCVTPWCGTTTWTGADYD